MFEFRIYVGLFVGGGVGAAVGDGVGLGAVKYDKKLNSFLNEQ